MQQRLGWTCLRSSSVERDLGVLVNEQLPVSEQCAVMAKKANRITDRMDCINKGITSREKITLSLSHSALVRPHLQYWSSVFSFGPWYAKTPQNHGQGGKGPGKSHGDNQRSGKPDVWRKAENWVHSALKKEGLREPLSPYSSFQKVATKKRLPFYKQSHGKHEGSCIKLLYDIPTGHRNNAIGTKPTGMCWIPQHWTL